MKASEIKERLLPFFGEDLIEKSVDYICGRKPKPSKEKYG